jgi:hypothetical protein
VEPFDEKEKMTDSGGGPAEIMSTNARASRNREGERMRKGPGWDRDRTGGGHYFEPPGRHLGAATSVMSADFANSSRHCSDLICYQVSSTAGSTNVDWASWLSERNLLP